MSSQDSTTEVPATSGDVQSRGQTRMADRFVAEHSDSLRYVHGLGWYVWTGTRWAPDSDGLPTRLAIQTVQSARFEGWKLEETPRKELWSDAAKCESDAGLRGLLSIASNLEPIAISAASLDRDRYLFNTLNGTLDLRTGELQPHNRTHLITKVAGCEYDPDAEGHDFLRFLSEILPDEDVRDYVQRLIGYAMLGTVKEHVLPLFIGRGRNGKSKFLEAVLRAFGDYGLTAAPTLLVERAPNAASTDKVDLMGKRIVVCSETDEGQRFAASTVKSLTGGDDVTARRLHKDFLTFTPSHTIFLMTNHPPRTDGSDSAMFERIRYIHFEQTFTGNRQDPDLSEKLDAERAVVLRWAVEGYQKYIEETLTAPAKVMIDTKKYQQRNDPLGDFLDQCCVKHEDASAGSRELYEEWKSWSGDNRTTEKAFSKKIEDRGYEKKRTRKGAKFVGIGLAEYGTDSDDLAGSITVGDV